MRDKETKLLRKVVAVAAIETGSMKEVMEKNLTVIRFNQCNTSFNLWTFRSKYIL